MLPFLKNRDDGAGVAPVETKERKHDDDYDLLDAVASDLVSALEKKDQKLVKAALASLCDYIQALDQEQDEMETK